MDAGKLKKSWPWARTRHVWMAGLSAAAVSGMSLLLIPSVSEHNGGSANVQAAATPAAHAAPASAGPAWARLSAIEQRTLTPLKDTWSTLTVEQQNSWRSIVGRVQAKPRHVQRRLASRIAEWASLTPLQRAHARLNFLELSERYNQGQRKRQWQAYKRAKPDKEPVTLEPAQPGLLPPALVQASPGATTVLLSRLFDLPSVDDVPERNEPVSDPPTIDGTNPQRMDEASAEAASPPDLERAAP